MYNIYLPERWLIGHVSVIFAKIRIVRGLRTPTDTSRVILRSRKSESMNCESTASTYTCLVSFTRYAQRIPCIAKSATISHAKDERDNFFSASLLLLRFYHRADPRGNITSPSLVVNAYTFVFASLGFAWLRLASLLVAGSFTSSSSCLESNVEAFPRYSPRFPGFSLYVGVFLMDEKSRDENRWVSTFNRDRIAYFQLCWTRWG